MDTHGHRLALDAVQSGPEPVVWGLPGALVTPSLMDSVSSLLTSLKSG